MLWCACEISPTGLCAELGARSPAGGAILKSCGNLEKGIAGVRSYGVVPYRYQHALGLQKDIQAETLV